jgi:dihydrofolate reductase
MGRKTFESIGKPLKNRTNIVISRTLNPSKEVIVSRDIESAIEIAESFEKNIFFIGGSEIYNQCINYCNTVYKTLVYTEVNNADTYFPKLSSKWIETSRIKFEIPDENNEFSFDIITLEYL